MSEFPQGEVWLVGAGPGDAGLLTLHAVEALKQADIVVHDALVSAAVLEYAGDAERVLLGKRGGKPSPKQPGINARLIVEAKAGKRVVRLKGGDPFMFGRGAEEVLALVTAGVRFRVIPGITAGIGGLAYAGIPVTARGVNSGVIFLTGHDHTGLSPEGVDWQAVGRAAGMIVLYMAMRHMGEISGKLIAGGLAVDTPVAVVMNASLPDMRVLETTLSKAAADIAASGIGAPAIVSIGQGNLLREAMAWR
ncbi:MAG: uroporphyrinogen-III C-methyltransferase [Rhodobacteraceae bacterium]|nr:uroporphyrinogen-III C-methyltransferase [Paracoccaceae bacterium]